MAYLKTNQIETKTLNIILNPQDEETINAFIDHVGLFRKDIEAQLHHKLLRLSKEKVKVACQIVGCKPVLAQSLADKTFETFLTLIDSECPALSPGDKARYYIYTTKTKFLMVFKEELKERNLAKDRNILDFELALSIIEQSQSMIVLLGGTSGSGKSTIASVLASRFGIPTILSTDSIRHVMRNFMSAEECPILFCSTYEAGSKIKCEEDVKENKKIVMGFQQQAAKVQERLEHILKDFYDRGESIVVEGVHLTPDFLTAMLKKFDNCIPFLIYISNESKHRERFAVRSKYMTLEKRHNKYVENFGNIRQIQKHLTKKAAEHLIPKLDNSNVDKSVGIIHRTLVRCLRRIVKGESLYDSENKNALKIYEQFNKVTKNIWSSDAVKKYIHSKSKKKTYKNEIFKRFFQQNVKPLPKEVYDNIEPEIRQNLLRETTGNDKITKGESQIPNKLKAFKEDFILLDEQDKEYSDQLKKFKSEDEIHQTKSVENSKQYPESPVRRASDKFEEAIDVQIIIGRGKSFEEGDQIGGNRKTQEPGESINLSKSQENLKILTNMVNRPTNLSRLSREKTEEMKIEDGVGQQGLSPSLPYRPVMRLNLLEEALTNKRVLILKGFTQGNVRSLKRFVEGYNIKHQDYYLKMFQESQRIIIQKRKKNDKDGSPMLPHSEGPRPQFRLSAKRYDDYAQEKTPRGKYGDTNTTEDNNEGSDEDSSPSVNSQEKWSTATGNLDVNLHLMKRGSTHYMSDQLDVSDDVDSVTKNEGEEETSMEVLQSGNSISEQSIEEDEDEDEEVNVKPFKLTAEQSLVAK